MALSSELASQLAKVINEDKKPTKGDTTVYGTVVEYDGRKYVKLDGSDRLTPVTATTSVKHDDRVTVMIKDHSAIVTGNLSDPAASDSTVTGMGTQITELGNVVAKKVSTEELAAETARIDTLVSDNVYIRETLTANEAKFEELEAETAKIKSLEADNVTINNTLTANKASIEQLEADIANIDAVSTKDLEAVNAEIHNLKGTYGDFEVLTTNKFSAVDAEIDRLDVDKLSATTADAMYANIDFSNIGKAAMEYFYATSGLIKDVTVGDATITGELIGVTIKGDLIEGNTIKAEKLVIKGSDGLYYKLNTDGVKTEAEQTEYNSLDGSNILANSIKATKIDVEDLVAFDATIGGFNISDSAIYSGVKETVSNTTRGIYLDKTGQMAIGDSTNYIKYFKDTDGKYKLTISAEAIKMVASGKTLEEAIEEVEATGISSVVVSYYQSTSSSQLTGGSWSTTAPTWADGKYIWSKTVTTLKNGTTAESTPVCITGSKGATGAAGKDGVNGADGAAGKDGSNGIGVKSIVEEYYRSTSNTDQAGGSWSTTVPTWVDGTYIWTRSTITYTDNTTSTTKPVCVTGAKGATGEAGKDGANGADGAAGKDGKDGADGIGIASVDVWYFLSTSATSLKNGEWSTTAPTWVDGKYIWSKTVTTYTDNTTTESTPVCITGAKGQNGSDGAAGKDGADGADGVGIKSITAQFYLSTSKTTQTGGSWVTTSPTWVTGTYLWTRSLITYTDDTTKTTSPLCDSSWEAVNEVEVGGRNLLLNTNQTYERVTTSDSVNVTTTIGIFSDYYMSTRASNKPIVISFDWETTGSEGQFKIIFNNTPWNEPFKDLIINPSATNKGGHVEYATILTDNCVNDTALYTGIGVRIDGIAGTTKLYNVKCEYGNKATTWSPAPEDVQNGIDNAQSDATEAKNLASEAKAAIEVLRDSIAMLVTDANGASLMTQTSTGWTFSTASIQEAMNNTSSSIDTLMNSVGSVESTVGELQTAVSDLGETAEYVHVGTFEDEPCIELGKTSSDYKVLITNTKILFKVGSNTPTSIDANGLNTDNITVDNELRQGGFVWIIHGNGNLGLAWKGVN